MSTLTLISGAESLEAQIIQLGEVEPHKAFLISHKLSKIADNLKKNYQEKAVEYWQENKELPGGYECKETSRSSYMFEMDAKWQSLKSELEAREVLLKMSADTDKDVFDGFGEVVPKVHKKQQAVYSFSQK